VNAANSVESVLIEYLQRSQVAGVPLDASTDLIESAWLDSLRVMDLVCFVASRFNIQMAPGDITPANLRSVECLARFVSARLSCASDAA
jgi:acyl carrier protein